MGRVGLVLDVELIACVGTNGFEHPESELTHRMFERNDQALVDKRVQPIVHGPIFGHSPGEPQTASAAASVNPRRKTDSQRNSRCSGSVGRSS